MTNPEKRRAGRLDRAGLLLNVLLLATLSACAPMQWQKAQSDAATLDTATLDNDLAECQRSARLSASQMAMGSSTAGAPSVITTPGGATSIQSTPLPMGTADPMLAQQFAVDCMHRKGYALVKSK